MRLCVTNWPTWEKRSIYLPVGVYYFILEGECVITPYNGCEAVSFTVGDLVVFPKGLVCTWEV
jgi:uncharacterized protein